MKTTLCLIAALLLWLNGYALNKLTHLYTPGFAYWLIVGFILAEWLAIALFWVVGYFDFHFET